MKREPRMIPHPQQCPHCYGWDKRLYAIQARAWIHKETRETKMVTEDVWECLNCGVRWIIARERAGDDYEPRQWR